MINFNFKGEAEMAAREFHCRITNFGTAPIEWVEDHLDHGVWGEHLPSQDARIIMPGQTARYSAESGGDIPIIGNIATGTEGWVLFRTTTASGSREYIIVKHNVPYWQAHETQAHAVVRAYKYDPTQEIKAGEFDERNMEPPETRIVGEYQGHGPQDEGPQIWQDIPWLALFTPPALVGVRISYRPYLSVGFTVTGNAKAPDHKFPDHKPQAFNPTFSIVRNSRPEFWAEAWEGSRIQAHITEQNDGTLSVRLRNKESNEVHEETVPIDRLLVSPTMPSLDRMKDAANKMVDVVVRKERFRLGGQEETTLLKELDKETVKQHPDFLGLKFTEETLQKPLGGDFLAFSDGSCLEIFSMTQNKINLGYALRYTSQTRDRVPVAAQGAYQEHLFVMASLR